jgi:hypothetical protein
MLIGWMVWYNFFFFHFTVESVYKMFTHLTLAFKITILKKSSTETTRKELLSEPHIHSFAHTQYLFISWVTYVRGTHSVIVTYCNSVTNEHQFIRAFVIMNFCLCVLFSPRWKLPRCCRPSYLFILEKYWKCPKYNLSIHSDLFRSIKHNSTWIYSQFMRKLFKDVH